MGIASFVVQTDRLKDFFHPPPLLCSGGPKLAAATIWQQPQNRKPKARSQNIKRIIRKSKNIVFLYFFVTSFDFEFCFSDVDLLGSMFASLCN